MSQTCQLCIIQFTCNFTNKQTTHYKTLLNGKHCLLHRTRKLTTVWNHDSHIFSRYIWWKSQEETFWISSCKTNTYIFWYGGPPTAHEIILNNGLRSHVDPNFCGIEKVWKSEHLFSFPDRTQTKVTMWTAMKYIPSAQIGPLNAVQRQSHLKPS